MTNPRRQSSHHRAQSVSSGARSCRPCVTVSSPGADTWEKNNTRALQYARWLTKLKPEERIYYLLTYLCLIARWEHRPSTKERHRFLSVAIFSISLLVYPISFVSFSVSLCQVFRGLPLRTHLLHMSKSLHHTGVKFVNPTAMRSRLH